jgi:hypothetical protein
MSVQAWLAAHGGDEAALASLRVCAGHVRLAFELRQRRVAGGVIKGHIACGVYSAAAGQWPYVQAARW